MATNNRLNQNLEHYLVSIGGLYITADPMILQTVLGSCIAITLFDPLLKIGGMNHFMLPGSFVGEDIDEMMQKKDTKYGLFSTEQLIYGMQKNGCQIKNLIAKIYGASLMGFKSKILNIQQENIDFVTAFLKMAQIRIVEKNILNEEALKISFNTLTGEVKVKKYQNARQ